MRELLKRNEKIYFFTRDIWHGIRKCYYFLCSVFVDSKRHYYECPCCGRKAYSFVCERFDKMPSRFNPERYANTRQDVLCPVCRSMPRHRIVAYYLSMHPEVLHGSILHFAQEKCLKYWFKRNGIFGFKTADLNEKADLKVDIQATGLQDNSFSLIICNHVLEHVIDFRKALFELYRICAPGGQVILSFPMLKTLEKTYEDASISTPEERVRSFGQNDHLRIFGNDSKRLIEETGFTVEEIDGNEFPQQILPIVGPADYDINVLFCCKK